MNSYKSVTDFLMVFFFFWSLGVFSITDTESTIHYTIFQGLEFRGLDRPLIAPHAGKVIVVSAHQGKVLLLVMTGILTPLPPKV